MEQLLVIVETVVPTGFQFSPLLKNQAGFAVLIDQFALVPWLDFHHNPFFYFDFNRQVNR
jgi:hypothetical protein